MRYVVMLAGDTAAESGVLPISSVEHSVYHSYILSRLDIFVKVFLTYAVFFGRILKYNVKI